MTFLRLCSCCCFFRPVSLSTRNFPGRTRASRPRRGILLLLAPLAPSLFAALALFSCNCLNSLPGERGKEKFGKRERGVVTSRFLAIFWRSVANMRLPSTIVPVLFCYKKKQTVSIFFLHVSTVKKYAIKREILEFLFRLFIQCFFFFLFHSLIDLLFFIIKIDVYNIY